MIDQNLSLFFETKGCNMNLSTDAYFKRNPYVICCHNGSVYDNIFLVRICLKSNNGSKQRLRFKTTKEKKHNTYLSDPRPGGIRFEQGDRIFISKWRQIHEASTSRKTEDLLQIRKSNNRNNISIFLSILQLRMSITTQDVTGKSAARIENGNLSIL